MCCTGSTPPDQRSSGAQLTASVHYPSLMRSGRRRRRRRRPTAASLPQRRGACACAVWRVRRRSCWHARYCRRGRRRGLGSSSGGGGGGGGSAVGGAVWSRRAAADRGRLNRPPPRRSQPPLPEVSDGAALAPASALALAFALTQPSHDLRRLRLRRNPSLRLVV